MAIVCKTKKKRKGSEKVVGKKQKGFPGGIHPFSGEDKELTRDKPVRIYLPGKVAVPLWQRFGGNAIPKVKEGEKVSQGDVIGQTASEPKEEVHASISGVITGIFKQDGKTYVQIESDGSREEKLKKEKQDWKSMTKEELIWGLRKGGLVGMGGAGFPVWKKYLNSLPAKILLINGAECEPFLTCDERLMIENPSQVVQGVRILLHISGAQKAIIGIEDNKPQACQAVINAIKEDDKIDLMRLPAVYPQGGEKQLIQSVLKTEVPYRGLPIHAGVIISNVATAKATADYFEKGIPLVSRIVTVSGEVVNPGNYRVPVGTSIRELLMLSGGVKMEENLVIEGGPMTGRYLGDRWTGERELGWISKTTSAILVLPQKEYEQMPCIRCEACTRSCPVGLIPYKIEAAYLKQKKNLWESLYADACIGCGCCSFVCPSRRNLAFHVREAAALYGKTSKVKGGSPGDR